MVDHTQPNPSEQLTPATAGEVNEFWIILLAIVALLGWLIGGFFMVSYKQTADKLTQLQDAASHNEVDSEPATVVNGKVYYKTITIHDTKTQTITVHDKTVTEIRSGVSLGLGFDVNLNPALDANADLLPFGPGNVQVWAAGSRADQMAGLAYRLNF